MRSKSFKRAAMLALTSGMLFHSGGCLGTGLLGWLGGLGRIGGDVAIDALQEFLWDSDAVFDAFGDDGPGTIL